MFITLKQKDISIVKKVLYANTHKEIGVLIKLNETIFFDYLRYSERAVEQSIHCIQDDLHKLGILGHTIAPNKSRSQFNPPKSSDILLSLKYPKSDFIVFDIAGLWVYRPNKILANIRLTPELTQEVICKCEENAEKLITDQIDLCVYLRHIKKINPCTKIGMIIKYIPYTEHCDIIHRTL